MICIVSTVKDSLENVTSFVQGNLAAGADHLFIFLEGGDREVLALLGEHDHVTLVDADRMHQRTPQPANLNARQTVNANRINALLAGIERASWLFHLDGDECLDIDTERLLALGPETAVVRLLPKEAVSSSTPEDAAYVKRLLTGDELSLLSALGVIDEPSNRSYFHGHLSGKVGIRPSLGYGLHIHEASLLGQEPAPEEFQADWLHLLHHDSLTPEEFLRKWSVHVAADSPRAFHGPRKALHEAMGSLARNEHLDADQKRAYMLEIYRRHIEDDAATLHRLGLLEKITHPGHRPDSFTTQEQATIDAVLPQLLTADVGYFRPRTLDRDPSELMTAIHGSSRPGHRGSSRR